MFLTLVFILQLSLILNYKAYFEHFSISFNLFSIMGFETEYNHANDQKEYQKTVTLQNI